MKMDRRVFLGLAAGAVAHRATKGLAVEAQPIPVNFDDIRIGQWADYLPMVEDEVEGPFYVGTMHPFFVSDLLADETIGPELREQLMCVPMSGGEAV